MDDEKEPGAGERQHDNNPSLSQAAEQISTQQEEQKSFTDSATEQVLQEPLEQPQEPSRTGEMPEERSEPQEQSQDQPKHDEQSQEQPEPQEETQPEPEEELQPGDHPEPEKQSANMVPACVSEPINTKGVSKELCWYCMKSVSVENLNITQLESEPPYQRDPRPHFGVAHSSRSTPFPLWDREGTREIKRDTEEEEDAGIVGSCPHCHLGLPLDTLRWHEEKCLLFEAPRKDS